MMILMMFLGSATAKLSISLVSRSPAQTEASVIDSEYTPPGFQGYLEALQSCLQLSPIGWMEIRVDDSVHLPGLQR